MKEEVYINDLVKRYPALESCKGDINQAIQAIIKCYSDNGKLLICGNGGSCADADHIVGELMKSFEKQRPVDDELRNSLLSVSDERGSSIAGRLQKALPAISLNAHTALYSAIANDIDAEIVFAQQVAGYGEKGDVLIAISTSGNSQNVIDAAITAKALGLTVIALTGQNGGKMKQYSDIAVCVPADNTADVQEFHLPVYHTICKMVESWFYE
ncbi:MAG: SIS domain-containing protein [Bacteroidetes bacterium]|jgi:phosphoheptose isomerase|nr:SIS domain-containing protein [Bacteroidota bacterium]MBT4399900.1 SIS domain-containing protein [Bacteroidota bacterium]MBT4410936.1 SIS domain-containing protein [Bacteroidota bacterium]MBT7094032.1 SIS domain-containing protein [Bacteroidota bacterium]MBT7466264.1 SIS domain-containing protein [Bacteroidota bacterium]